MNFKVKLTSTLLLSIVFLGAINCNSGKRRVIGETEWQKKMNADFKDATKSPLKKKDREIFSSLDFFKHDSAFIFNANLVKTPNTPFFEMPTSSGDITKERVYGILNFTYKNKTYKLEVYQGEELMTTSGYEDYLFLPFYDDTNGETTYGGGRYIGLKIPDGSTIKIDFNEAYNPYCAYNEKFSCPIVPQNNYLAFKVLAGVKAYKKH